MSLRGLLWPLSEVGLLRWDYERSPVVRAVLLRRVDPQNGMARFYSLVVERDL
jgi:hypothetical protein